MDQSLIPSNVLERLRHAQGGPEVGGPSVSSLSAQPRIPLQTSSQQYLSPYASANTVFSPLSTTKVLPADNSSTMSNPAFAAKVHEIIARAKANGALEVQRGSVEWNVAREAVIADMKEHGSGGTFYGTTGSTTTSSIEARTARMQGQSPRTASPIALGTIKLDPTVEGTFTASPSGRNRAKGRSNRGGRLRTSKGVGSMRKGKRKRTGAEDGGGDSDDTDSSENFSPLPTQSRSGRKIFQTNTSAPTVKIDEKAALVQPPSSTPRWGSNDSRKKKKASYRRSPSANALCKNCTRGHSPARNVIVFCDGCNTPWHQYCHDPPITGEVVQIEEKDWFCADCTILRAEEEKLEGRIAGEGMSLAEVNEITDTVLHRSKCGSANDWTEATISPDAPSRPSRSFLTPCMLALPFPPIFCSKSFTCRQSR